MSARKTALAARKALLNGSGRLSYFEDRRIDAEIVKDAWIGYDPNRDAFTYPCIAKGGGLLGIHYKSIDRDVKGKRRQWWGGYANDLPPKRQGEKPREPAKVIPFGMESLEGLHPASQVILCCGKEDALSTRQLGYTAVSQPGAGLLEPVYAQEFAGLEMVVFYDAGEEQAARRDALKLLEAGAENVRVVEWPAEVSNGSDVNGRLVEDPEGFRAWVAGMIASAELLNPLGMGDVNREGDPDRYSGEDRGSEAGKPTQAELLLRGATGADVFHTPAGDAYATVPVDGHRETHLIKSKGFRRWLVRGFYSRHGKPPGAQALQDALGLLEAKAQFDGQEHPVHVRVAEHEGAIYVDLANDRWEAVEITQIGWRMVADPPVRFRRPRGMLALPRPAKDGTAKQLRRFINIEKKDQESWCLLLAWLVQALRPTGPYPVLILLGEQGSAKSTVERVLRALVDPSTAPLRTTPKGERDLIIAATNAWVVAFDNISTLQPWCSDALCRLSTGGGFSARELYTDSEEVLFDATRPVILNGITDVATRPDLLDRALVVTLPPIPKDKRKPESELWEEFERIRPGILGALFDAVSAALRNLPFTKLDSMPRMADFAAWASAAEGAFGWMPETFMEAYSGNREEANETALEAEPVAGAVQKFMKERDEWTGIMTELWKKLGALVDDEVRRSKAWPKSPNALSRTLKRLAPALREVGIEYEDGRRPGGSRTRTKSLKKKPAKDRTDRPAEQKSPANQGDGSGTVRDDVRRARDEAPPKTVPGESPADEHLRDDRDDRDDGLRPYSKGPVAAAREDEDDRLLEETGIIQSERQVFEMAREWFRGS